jgi:hypothetical protein
MSQSIADTRTETAKDIVERLNKLSQELERLSFIIFNLTCGALISTLLMWGVMWSLFTTKTYISSNILTALQLGCVFSILLGYCPLFLLSTFEKKTQRGYVALHALEEKVQQQEATDETKTGNANADNDSSNVDFPSNKERFLKSSNIWPYRGLFTTMWYFRGRFRFADMIYIVVNIAVVLSSTYLLVSTFPAHGAI